MGNYVLIKLSRLLKSVSLFSSMFTPPPKYWFSLAEAPIPLGVLFVLMISAFWTIPMLGFTASSMAKSFLELK